LIGLSSSEVLSVISALAIGRAVVKLGERLKKLPSRVQFHLASRRLVRIVSRGAVLMATFKGSSIDARHQSKANIG